MFDEYNELLTVEELQELLRVGKNTAYDLLKQNKIKAFRIGKLWKIPKENVRKYITETSR